MSRCDLVDTVEKQRGDMPKYRVVFALTSLANISTLETALHCADIIMEIRQMASTVQSIVAERS